MATLPRNPDRRLESALRWTARTLTLASFAFVLAFLIGGGATLPLTPTGSEWIGLAFFPTGVLVGLALGWWRPTAGGATSVASLALFYLWMLIDRGRFPGGPWFALVALPGALFLLLGWLERRWEPRV